MVILTNGEKAVTYYDNLQWELNAKYVTHHHVTHAFRVAPNFPTSKIFNDNEREDGTKVIDHDEVASVAIEEVEFIAPVE